MVPPVSVILTYCLMGLTGVTIGYFYLCDLFVPLRRLAIYLAFFSVRFLYDALVYYSPAALGRDFVPFELRTPLAYVWSIASFSCILLVFEGPKLELLAVSFFTNMVTSVETAAAMSIANLLFRGSIDAGYWVPFDAGVPLAIALSVAEGFLLRRPTAHLGRFVRIAARRSGSLIVVGGVALFVAYIAFAMQIFVYLPFSDMSLVILVLSLMMLAQPAVSLYMGARELRANEALISEFDEMLAAYDAKARERLALLERDHELFADVSAALSRLEEERVTPEQRERIVRLEDSYRAMTEGTYCDSPALDAVLVSYGDRLRELGVDVSLSAVGERMEDLDTAFIALVLLDHVLLMARQATSAKGERVVLRLRDAGKGVLYHLDIPASWKRAIPWYRLNGAMRRGIDFTEHVSGDRMVVLAMRGGDSE